MERQTGAGWIGSSIYVGVFWSPVDIIIIFFSYLRVGKILQSPILTWQRKH